MEERIHEPQERIVEFDGTEPERDSPKNPHLIIYQGLSYLNLGQTGLEITSRQAASTMEILDDCPRHDVDLDDQTWSRLEDCNPHRGQTMPIGFAMNGLHASLERLHYAMNCVQGNYHGELKVKIEDRLARHLRQADQILKSFRTIRAELTPPRKPYLIRQLSMSGLVHELDEVVENMKATRDQVTREQVGEDVYEKLLELEQNLRRMRAAARRWRDNPSQKLGSKSRACHEEVLAINESIEELREVCLERLTKAGVVLYNRVGRVEAQLKYLST